MEAEHCLREGHSMSFTTSNYGVITTPRAEWRFVVEGLSDGIDMRHSRRLPDIADLCASELADSAKLTRAAHCLPPWTRHLGVVSILNDRNQLYSVRFPQPMQALRGRAATERRMWG